MSTPTYSGTRVFDPPAKPNHSTGHYIDPWRALCAFCRFDDCIRAEGDSAARPDHDYTGCLIYDATTAGLTPGQALAEVERGD